MLQLRTLVARLTQIGRMQGEARQVTHTLELLQALLSEKDSNRWPVLLAEAVSIGHGTMETCAGFHTLFFSPGQLAEEFRSCLDQPRLMAVRPVLTEALIYGLHSRPEQIGQILQYARHRQQRGQMLLIAAEDAIGSKAINEPLVWVNGLLGFAEFYPEYDRTVREFTARLRQFYGLPEEIVSPIYPPVSAESTA